MELELFRISLKETIQLDVFDQDDDDALNKREKWLRHYFSEVRQFTHRKIEFLFVPEKSIVNDRIIAGWVAREVTKTAKTSPEDGLVATTQKSWQASFLAIDPTEHDDGQKMAFEVNAEIGVPSALVGSLVSAMNAFGMARRYTIAVYPIIEEASFWKFVEKNGSEINRISFDVAVPNMFKGVDDLQTELRDLKEDVNVSRVKTMLESDGVLNYNDDKIREIVDYTEKGAGKLTARALSGAVYNSDSHSKSLKPAVVHHSVDQKGFLKSIFEFLDRVF